MLTDIEYTKVILLGHREALGGAYGGAQTTKAALAHVDVKFCRVNTFGCSIRSLAKFVWRFDWLNGDAIHRAYFGAFVAHNAIINFIMQLIAARVGYAKRYVWVLYGGNALLMVEVIRLPDVMNRAVFSGLYQMPPG